MYPLLESNIPVKADTIVCLTFVQNRHIEIYLSESSDH